MKLTFKQRSRASLTVWFDIFGDFFVNFWALIFVTIITPFLILIPSFHKYFVKNFKKHQDGPK